jgi:MoaA/NifB/PqqE/SkfB family radical SAM enzyme
MITKFIDYVPTKIKYLVAPYYRLIYPNKLYVMVWPTFRCNYNCSYCTYHTRFDYAKVFKDIEPEKWLKIFQKLPPAHLYFCGGEPFLYKGFDKVINNMPVKHAIIGIITNASLPIDVYKRIKKKPHLNVSLHRDHVSVDEFVDKIVQLKKIGYKNIIANTVATPKNLRVMHKIYNTLKEKGIGFHIDPYEDANFEYKEKDKELLDKFVQADRSAKRWKKFKDYSPKICSAGRTYMNIMPSGEAYTCFCGMEYNKSPLVKRLVAGRKLPNYNMKNVVDKDFRLRSENMICGMPCRIACDLTGAEIKLK